MSRGVRALALAAAAVSTVLCLAAGYDVLAWPAYGCAMFLLASLVYDNGPVGEREDSDIAPAQLDELRETIARPHKTTVLRVDDPTVGLPAVGRASVAPAPARHAATDYVYPRYRPSRLIEDTRPMDLAAQHAAMAGHPDLDEIDWSAPLMTLRGPLCWECTEPYEDPLPWCDCRDDERCKGPCRNRAHAPGRCPGVTT